MRTVNAVDAYDIFQDGRSLVWRFPVQQHAVCADAGERDEGRDGHLEAKQGDELFDGLGEHLVGAECDPEEGREHAGRLEPARRQEDEGLHVVVGDVRRPVEGVLGVGQHRGGRGGRHQAWRWSRWSSVGMKCRSGA